MFRSTFNIFVKFNTPFKLYVISIPIIYTATIYSIKDEPDIDEISVAAPAIMAVGWPLLLPLVPPIMIKYRNQQMMLKKSVEEKC